MTNYVNYIEKYKPNKSVDFIGYFKFTNDFKERLNNNTFNKIITCIGYSGSGKSSLLKKIFEELNYDYKEFHNQERFKEDIETFINYKTINEFFKKKKKLIFIDDLDIMSYDKGVINYLLNIDNKNIPIICIINKIYSRKFTDFKKKGEIFYLPKLTMDKCYKYIISICNNENHDLNENKLKLIKTIIKNNNFNIKNILLNLDSLLKNQNNTIDYNEVDKDLYDNIDILIKNKYPIIELEKMIINDTTLISMLLHENFFTYFNKKSIKSLQDYENTNKNEKNKVLSIISIYEDILDDICVSDKIEKFIFKNIDWKLYNLMSILKIYKLNSYYSKLKINNDFNKIIFTQILTKYSLRYNFNKKKFILLDEFNLSSKYFDNLLQNILQNIAQNIAQNIENKHANETNKELINFSKYKDYLDILKKYNKEFKIINNDCLNLINNLNKIK